MRCVASTPGCDALPRRWGAIRQCRDAMQAVNGAIRCVNAGARLRYGALVGRRCVASTARARSPDGDTLPHRLSGSGSGQLGCGGVRWRGRRQTWRGRGQTWRRRRQKSRSRGKTRRRRSPDENPLLHDLEAPSSLCGGASRRPPRWKLPPRLPRIVENVLETSRADI